MNGGLGNIAGQWRPYQLQSLHRTIRSVPIKEAVNDLTHSRRSYTTTLILPPLVDEGDKLASRHPKTRQRPLVIAVPIRIVQRPTYPRTRSHHVVWSLRPRPCHPPRPTRRVSLAPDRTIHPLSKTSGFSLQPPRQSIPNRKRARASWRKP